MQGIRRDTGVHLFILFRRPRATRFNCRKSSHPGRRCSDFDCAILNKLPHGKIVSGTQFMFRELTKASVGKEKCPVSDQRDSWQIADGLPKLVLSGASETQKKEKTVSVRSCNKCNFFRYGIRITSGCMEYTKPSASRSVANANFY